jgi:hypothetical protein
VSKHAGRVAGRRQGVEAAFAVQADSDIGGSPVAAFSLSRIQWRSHWFTLQPGGG